MKKYILICLLLAVPFFAEGQNKLSLNAGYGYFLSNSENSLPLMEREKYRSFFLFGAAHEREDFFGIHFGVEYTFSQITKENVIEFVYTHDDPTPIGTFGSDATLITHSIDFSWINEITADFSFGIGPSFVIINRIYETDNIPTPERGQSISLYDKLASSAVGVNGFFYFEIPLDNNPQYFFFNSKLKLRYTHSIWYDKGLRKLDDYNQDFFTGNISAGVGYSF